MVRVGDESNTAFTPKIQLLSPTSVSLGSSAGAAAAELAVRATNTGTFTVIISDNSGTLTGRYRLSLAKTGSAITVSPGDQGGPLTNGVAHKGTVLTGDLDSWAFDANSGDAVVLRIGEVTTTNSFTPWIRLYGPSGLLLGSAFGSAAAEVTIRATNSGTFLVVVGDGNGALSGTGDYRLTLAKTGDPVVISDGDEGGPMTNGLIQTGTILTGDLDLWTFAAHSGDAVVLRIGKVTTTNSFTPWIRLYGPSGLLLGSGFGSAAGEVTIRATNSGTFLVVVGDGNGAFSGTGDYRLTLAKTGDPVVISEGDSGGPLNSGVNPQGTINFGDLDIFVFTTCRAELVKLRVDKLIDNGNFTPWLRIYGPHGALLGSVANSTGAQINFVATNSGTFLAIVSDGNGSFSGTGTYQLISNGLANQLRLCDPIISGTHLDLTGIGGVTNAVYVLYQTLNVETPQTLWTPIVTNQFDQFGVFNRTNLFDPAVPHQFFRFRTP